MWDPHFDWYDTIRKHVRSIVYCQKGATSTETELWYDNDTYETLSSSSSSSYIHTKELQVTFIVGKNWHICIMLQSVGSYLVLELHGTQFMSTIDLTILRSPGNWTYLNTNVLVSLQRAIKSSSSSSLQYRPLPVTTTTLWYDNNPPNRYCGRK